MTTRITKPYSLSPVFKVNYTEVPDSVLVAAYHLSTLAYPEPARGLLAAHGLDEEEISDVLFALNDLARGEIRTYSVDEYFLGLLKLPEPGNPVGPPKLTVVVRGGIVQYITYDGDDTPTTPRVDVMDIDAPNPTWSEEDRKRVESQLRIW